MPAAKEYYSEAKQVELVCLLGPTVPATTEDLINDLYGIPDNFQSDKDKDRLRNLISRCRDKGWKITRMPKVDDENPAGYTIDKGQWSQLLTADRIGILSTWTKLPRAEKESA